ncbi:substrate-binding periplasmic protein [Thalassomonas actiniarum]|uniref:Transporter substrate-binding domain-containing protein n=1 Tax=Thalassomonas actiniarum TaxID=485447 RepID=A0AAF0C4N8_9GAMM|nr:transporter substrate-binding domain-containing protein [Thalassomonas actiniarum]WDE00179.1 transporter substrate-binding domain-containing protein [Thalassomonas actiniarum]
MKSRLIFPVKSGALLLLFCFFSLHAQSLRFVAEELPPFHFTNEHNQPDGALVELTRALLFQAELKGDIELLPFARAYNVTKGSENTFLLSLLKTPVRENNFKWVGQSYKTRAFLVGLKSRKDIKLDTLDSAKAYNVGTIRGYYSETFLKQAGFKEKQNLSLSVKYEHMWQMLFKGRIDLVLTNFIALEREIASIGLNAGDIGQYIQVKDFPDELYLATGLKTPDKLVERLSAALTELKSNGRYQQILDKWQL